MIHLFGGIRFRCMDLFNVSETQLLVDACAGTLESLRLYPTGNQHSSKDTEVLANRFADRWTLWGFDLSRNKSLRTLEVSASSIHGVLRGTSPDAPSSLLKHAFSTITSPAFSEVVVVYRDYDFSGVQDTEFSHLPPLCEVPQVEKAREDSQHRALFEMFREIYKVREFRLVLCADVRYRVGEYTVQMLREAIAAEKAERGFDVFFPEPLVIYNPRESQVDVDEELYAAGAPTTVIAEANHGWT